MTPQIRSFEQVVPMIYAYTTPTVTSNEGWIKIGYTEKQTVEQRINQQTHTASIPYTVEWQDNALYKDGSGKSFTDHDFHQYLEVQKSIERRPKTEWFHTDAATSYLYFGQFASRKDEPTQQGSTYELRQEQQDAVAKTKAYFEKGGTEFLWNAKPRFGKTLTCYDLIRQMGFQKVLIVTNRPAIANSWAEDFNKFIGWRGKLRFVSDTDALKGKKGVYTREAYLDAESRLPEGKSHGMVAFESLQGLKGSVYFGGNYQKLEWMAKSYNDLKGITHHGIDFDLLVIDEAQEGIDTIRTEHAFENISRKHTLYLSGTPFKALASGQFSEEQIYNWSYADEQERKASWQSDDYNPYEVLPQLSMYTYQISGMIQEKLERGVDLENEDGAVDYAFDLNEFFLTKGTGESTHFVHEEEVKKFLRSLTSNEKYPFSTTTLRKELAHTLWMLNRVDSCKALARMMKSDEFKDIFGEYEIIVAAGDGKLSEDEETEKAFDRVKKAIAEHEKTITLSVGQLTVGVTIPEWSGVLMLCNLKSPSSYMQAAFRAQNPCMIRVGAEQFRKERAYIFDFDPARTLIIFDEFANNLLSSTTNGGGTAEERKENIQKLLNFFPVLGEDAEGKMVELDAAAVLTIPRRLKSLEVVRRGFMSNFLFQNISNVFGAPGTVREILEKLTPAKEENPKKERAALDPAEDISLDDTGNVVVPEEIVIGKSNELFGNKIYAAPEAVEEVTSGLSKDPFHIENTFHKVQDAVQKQIKKEVIDVANKNYQLKPRAAKQVEKAVNEHISREIERIKTDTHQKIAVANAEFEKRKAESTTSEEIESASNDYHNTLDELVASAGDSLKSATETIFKDNQKNVVEQMEKLKAEEKKSDSEDWSRARLRGFCRSIPSFVMAYGDENLTLANFDDYTEDDVFKEVTGMPEEDFRYLRDGGERISEATGKLEHFEGHLFNEVVFNDSIQEFLKKKKELANYFDESKDEDIFDYIPPQKTNQIFTPKKVVQDMVDRLEKENPGCFDDPNKTFADLYMKSGLFITEIVKRLFRSPKMKQLYPDDKARIEHILRKQVYGMAPTRIIYLIATNYILGFDETLKLETKNFVQADAAEASKDGTLEELCRESFNLK